MRKSTRLALLLLGLVALGALTGSSAASEKGAKKDGSKKKGGIKGSFIHEGKTWTIHTNEEGRAWFYNSETGKAQWTDPRTPEATPFQRTMVLVAIMSPFVLMAVGGLGYIWWLKTHQPELLKGPKKVKGMKNWERALQPPKISRAIKERARSSSPPPEDAKKSS